MYHSLEKDLVYYYLFTFERESHSVSDMHFFCVSSLILSHLELLRIELLKLTSSILMEIVTIPVVLFDQLYFYMQQPIKDWLLKNYP